MCYPRSILENTRYYLTQKFVKLLGALIRHKGQNLS
jgi:hypothetical protein